MPSTSEVVDQRSSTAKGPRRTKRTEGEAQHEKLATDEAQAVYRLRGPTVECDFGGAKGNRRLKRFHGRGLRPARAETGLLILAQNLLRLDKLQRNAIKPMKQAG